ncbi:MAG: MFS transporter [Thermomicrobiales bacterium]
MPVLVERDQLVSANGKLEASTSLAQVTGPGIGGLLVGLFSAPVAILFDVATYLVSSIAIFGIRAPEPDHVPSQESIRSQIAEGIGFIRSNRTLRVLAGSSVINNLFGLMFVSVFVLYLTRELDMGPSMVGLIFAIGGAGAVVGAASASRISAALGVGRTLVLTQLGMGISGLLVPLALFVPSRAALLIGMVEFIQFVMIVVYAVNAVSLRQAITPQRLQGRVNAAFRFFSFGMQPFGSLIGGICGGLIGLAPTLIVAQVGIFSAFILLAGSTLRSATTIPAHDAAMQ